MVYKGDDCQCIRHGSPVSIRSSAAGSSRLVNLLVLLRTRPNWNLVFGSRVRFRLVQRRPAYHDVTVFVKCFARTPVTTDSFVLGGSA